MQPTHNRILYVDDHEDSRWMMKALLEMWNYEVVLAGAADDGLHLAQSEHFDVYLLDTHLPDESGFGLCEQICGVPGHAPVISSADGKLEQSLTSRNPWILMNLK
jgi:DNA-binding response OmpR family regulator